LTGSGASIATAARAPQRPLVEIDQVHGARTTSETDQGQVVAVAGADDRHARPLGDVYFEECPACLARVAPAKATRPGASARVADDVGATNR